jgi:hypothetical protein
MSFRNEEADLGACQAKEGRVELVDYQVQRGADKASEDQQSHREQLSQAAGVGFAGQGTWLVNPLK